MAKKPTKRPRDPIQLAKLIGDIATGQIEDNQDDGKNAAAVARGKLGGIKGGKARSDNLSKERKTAIAKKAANSRWKKKAASPKKSG